MKPVLGLTMGDPAGIGPELCLRALHDPTVLKHCVPIVFGAATVLKRVASAARFDGIADVPTVSIAEWERGGAASGPLIVDCAALDADAVIPGKISATCGKAAYRFIECAIQSTVHRRIVGVVTAPAHKESLSLAGIPYPGHTEIFTALTGARRSCMMLRSDVLTVSMVTTHVGYRDVPAKLTVGRILDVIELTAGAMRTMLQREPNIGVCGLNPHAGEHGLFGDREEERAIGPAVAQAVEKGIRVEGPLVPDAAFTAGQRKKYDAIVTMYHDQGHVPFKMLAFDTGVNITLGLPIVRTSVDHGTAFDIAWQGKADPRSLYEAIRVASELVQGGEG